MSEAADERAELLAGIRRLGLIVDDTKALVRRSRITFWLLGGLLVAFIAVGILALNARHAADDDRQQREALEGVVANQRGLIVDLRETQERQRVQASQVILEACRSRNEANRQIRGEFRRAYLNVYRLGPRDSERRAAIQELILGIPDAEMQDRDCDDNDILTRRDYPLNRG